MREFEERRKTRKLLHSRYAIAALFVIVVLVSRGVWSAYDKYRKSSEVAERMRTELSSLKQKESTLSASLSELDTPEGKEREVRDRFGAVKEGERLIILLDDEPTSTPVSSDDDGIWDRIKALFSRD